MATLQTVAATPKRQDNVTTGFRTKRAPATTCESPTAAGRRDTDTSEHCRPRPHEHEIDGSTATVACTADGAGDYYVSFLLCSAGG